jgi:hypothetical protein
MAHDQVDLAIRPAAREDGPDAEPEEIGPADQRQQVEHDGVDHLRADDGDEREPGPEQIADQVAEKEARAGQATLRRADAEHSKHARAWRQRVDRAGHGSGDEDLDLHEVRSPGDPHRRRA